MHGDPSRTTRRSWVALQCAGYETCVPAAFVVAVEQDVVGTPTTLSPFIDLGARWGTGPRERAPYVVWLQDGEIRIGVAVDDVRQFNSDAPTRPVPALGLRYPGLFDGCLERDGGLRLVLSLAGLVELTAEPS